MGFLGAVQIGVGEFAVTGVINTYFDDSSIAREVIANAESSVDVRFDDDSAHSVLIDVPRTKLSEGAPAVPGKNDDVVADFSYQGLRHATLGYTMKIIRFHGTQ